MRLWHVVRLCSFAAWMLFGTTSIGVAMSIFGSEVSSISFQGKPIELWLVVFYVVTGFLFFLEGLAVLTSRKIGMVIPVLLGLFCIMALCDEVSRILSGGVLIYKYLAMYSVVLLTCLLSLSVIYNITIQNPAP